MPIIARACAAIPETRGRRRPACARAATVRKLFAEAIDRARCRTTRLRDDLVDAGGRGCAEFDRRPTTSVELLARAARGGRDAAPLRRPAVRRGRSPAAPSSTAATFAERLVGRGHDVAVLTTCAASYVDWANVFDPGWSRRSTASRCTGSRSPSRATTRSLRPAQRAHQRGASDARPLSVQREWMRMQGPYTPELVPWLRRHAPALRRASSSSRTSTGRRGPGCQCVGGAVPTLLHPTAHDEPPLRLSIFDEVFRLPDAFAFLTPEEAELVRRRFPGAPAGEVVGIGVDLTSAWRRAPRSAGSSARRRPVPALRRPRRPGQGRGRAARLLRRVQGAQSRAT